MVTIEFYGLKSKYGRFSNFYKRNVTIDGKVWSTTEHYFQVQEEIRQLTRPRDAARKGRTQAGLRSDWEQVKDDVMRTALRAKFTQHEDLKELLLNTNNSKLVEISPTDSYWGNAEKNGTEGKNMLGILLMEIREELKNEKESESNEVLKDD
ncbi:11526_t:CDS:2 [Diversispora eburnea]|uniref:11526_t:CDS:1 n=1 Tax=Diversispora eburnea TaxID=1213867 RepID=A0A9N9GT24_9GLOM|nr:11526_t:CDS:2 [Diversispora eburnea]